MRTLSTSLSIWIPRFLVSYGFLGTCDAYPQAVVVFMAPVAYGPVPRPSHLLGREIRFPSDCPSTAAQFVPDWTYYVAGSASPGP